MRAVLLCILAVALLPMAHTGQARAEVDVYTTVGTHQVNGRYWHTACEPYSRTQRCTTWIWGTTVTQTGGRFVQKNSWVFNNLTYKTSPRALWGSNPLANTGAWTAPDGRDWRTECDTPTTGGNGCRSYTRSTVIESYFTATGNRGFRWATKWVFNNIVRFGPLAGDPVPSPTTPPSPGVLRLPTGTGTVIASGLDNPWSLVFVDGRPLFTQRDRETISTIVNGSVVTVATISAVAADGEGGLLGLAHSPLIPGKLFVYYTGSSDNRVVSYTLARSGSSFTLSSPQVLVSGIPKARSHNGGRIGFGPDDMLYIATGDAGDPARSQNPDSLGGKILRVNPATGAAAAGNPFGNRVWSYGHRNVQGLAWADDGTMWASELGQSAWDELNIIRPGANYGWPEVEGVGGGTGFTNPVTVWDTDEASPSGLLWKDQNLYMAALQGRRMWVMLDDDPDATKTDVLIGNPGRLRDIVAAPDGTIWVLTSNNTDDKIISYRLGG